MRLKSFTGYDTWVGEARGDHSPTFAFRAEDLHGGVRGRRWNVAQSSTFHSTVEVKVNA